MRAWLCAALIALLPGLAAAQSIPGLSSGSDSQDSPEPNVIEVDGEAILEIYDQWRAEIAGIEAEIDRLSDQPDITATRVPELIERIDALTRQTDAAATEAEARLDRPSKALSAMGSPPTGEEPPEASIVAEERERQQRTVARHQAMLTFVRVIEARAESAMSQLAGYGEFRWRRWIATRERPGEVLTAPLEGFAVGEVFTGLEAGDVQVGQELLGPWFPVLAALVGAVAVAAAIWLVRAVPRFDEGAWWEVLRDRRRLALARVAAAFGHGVLPAVACAALAVLAIHFAPEMGQWLGIVAAALIGLAIYIWLYRIFAIALKPTREKARFLKGSDAAAQRIAALLQTLCSLVAVLVAGYLLIEMSAGVSAGTLLALKLVAVVGLSGYALFAASRSVFDADDPDRLRRLYSALRIAVAVIGLTALAAALTGYVNLAVFASIHIAGSILLIAATYFMRPMLHDGIRALFSQDSDSFAQPRRSIWEALLHLGLDLLVLVWFLVLMLALWGVPFDAVMLWVRQATNALTIGEFRVGLADVVAAILAFAVTFAALRFVVGVVRHQILERISLDSGVRDSIVTILGYVGFLIAALVAVAMLGVDITSLALVFGALLLGVGFGLQNLVDNLVSGLIILFQRPIKAGDWITVGDYQGLVRKTGLIATEVSTFEHASVVLPNSEIVSNAVMNRTLGRTQGRVDVPVGVAYDSDVGKVLEVLKSVAADSDKVLQEPESTVVLKDFSDSSLNFELRAFVPDIRNIFEIASELRLEILKRFRDEGVTIPFPQRDLWLKNAEALAESLPSEEGRGPDAADAGKADEAEDADASEDEDRRRQP